MSQTKKSIFFPVFILTLLGVCICGLILFQIIQPADKSSHAPNANFNAPLNQNNTDEERALTKEETEPDFYTVANIKKTFELLNYDLTRILENKNQVPKLYFKKLPIDLENVKETQLRKSIFFKSLLPLILKANDEIMQKRARVHRLYHRITLKQAIRAKDRLWLETQFARYRVNYGDFKALLVKIDRIPPSLALAQAAEESGWGTSRFVKEGNALFGQWTFDENARGIVPEGRESEKKHRIKAFNSLYDSLRDYIFNLNRHKAYADFRKRRAELRQNPTRFLSRRLATSLGKYSERGDSYVQSLQTLIRQNNLNQFDRAQLQDGDDISYQKLLSAPTTGS